MKPHILIPYLFIVLFFSSFRTFAVEKILFLGLSGEGAPAIEQTFDRVLRERLSVVPDFVVIDYIETLRCRKHTEFNDHPTVSEKMLNDLLPLLPDSVTIVWGSIKKLTLEPVRRKLITAAINAELTVGLSVYHLAERHFAYNGNVESFFKKQKGFVFFTPINETPPLGAAERTAIIDHLINDGATKSAGIISSLVRSEQLRAASLPKQDSADGHAPSISDVFTVPSVEPPAISNLPVIESSDSIPFESSAPPADDKNKSSTGTK